jgi:hypothetical protein
MVVTAVLVALCADTSSHRRSDSKKSGLHIDRIFPCKYGRREIGRWKVGWIIGGGIME